jgi:hypothetical protein
MAKAIKSIHDRINLALKKGATGYIPPARIDDEIYAEILNIWNDLLPKQDETMRLSEYMEVFKESEPVTLTSGIGTIVGDYVTQVEDNNGIEIDILSDADWSNRVNHPIKLPETGYAIGRIDNKVLTVLPNDTPTAKVYSLRRPLKPVYAYTVSGSRFVYDDGNSVDLEFNVELHDQIVNKVLLNLGLPLREDDVLRYGLQEEAKRN